MSSPEGERDQATQPGAERHCLSKSTFHDRVRQIHKAVRCSGVRAQDECLHICIRGCNPSKSFQHGRDLKGSRLCKCVLMHNALPRAEVAIQSKCVQSLQRGQVPFWQLFASRLRTHILICNCERTNHHHVTELVGAITAALLFGQGLFITSFVGQK